MTLGEAYAVIPARYKSTRFPGKPLTLILGKPMVLWVAEACSSALGRNNVIIATDDSAIKRTVEEAGFRVEVTSSSALTGTDRVAEVAKKYGGTTVLNVQGDEPMVSPADIRQVADFHLSNPEVVVNCYLPLSPEENPERDTLPKVVLSESQDLIYASRSVIPGNKVGEGNSRHTEFLKQVCIYAFSPQQLEKFAAAGQKTPLEAAEDIEILRFLEQGQKVKMLRVTKSTIAVDTPEDVHTVESAMRASGYPWQA